MKTMFRIEANTYTDCEGRYTEWKAVTEWVTKEEAMNATENIARSYSMTGDWRLVARTIDEATFTVADEIITTFDWWKEIGRKEDAKRCMKVWEKEIEKAEAIRARTEKGEARKAKAIADAREVYERYRAIVEG